MSPAHSEKPMDMEVFSWVGVIMYLPPNQTNEQRELIKSRFNDYLDLIRPLLEEYKAHAHWAKIETPSSTPFSISPNNTDTATNIMDSVKFSLGLFNSSNNANNNNTNNNSNNANNSSNISSNNNNKNDRLDVLRSRLADRYPLNEFNSYRKALDPHNILANELIDNLIS